MSTLKKSHAISPFAWAARNSAQVGPDRRGDDSTPWRFKIAQTLEGATTMPTRSPVDRAGRAGKSSAWRRGRGASGAGLPVGRRGFRDADGAGVAPSRPGPPGRQAATPVGGLAGTATSWRSTTTSIVRSVRRDR